ncbi:MAG TPA: galactokinase [Novosphingobium sp.]|nr:galactokinase [Novosphingobium sp.]
MSALAEATLRGFAEAFGHAPDIATLAPGRVNLIGEHTDYNDGWVLPMAIGVGTVVVARRLAEPELRIAALDLGQSATVRLDDPIPPAPHGDWSNYLRGVAQALREQGLELAGAELAIAGNVPQGAGLSSSAALEVAAGLALAALAGAPDHDRTLLAQAGQQAEHRYAGCQCGIMDQLVSARGEASAALLIDCRSLATHAVPIPADAAVLIVHSGVRRGLVEGEYNQRRAQCEAAARHFAVPALRDLDAARLEAERDALDPTVYRRARHVVSENARTLAAAEALQAGDLARMGALMAQSHQSMREDFAITTPEIDHLRDLLAESLGAKGGARMTGGGFGGAVVAVGARAAIAAAADLARDRYRTPDGAPPEIMIETACAGARLLAL